LNGRPPAQTSVYQKETALLFLVEGLNFLHGRVGAINLEQLDTLFNSLKTYWDYSNNNALLAELKSGLRQPEITGQPSLYEL